MGCSPKFFKYSLYIINVVILIFAITLIRYGAACIILSYDVDINEAVPYNIGCIAVTIGFIKIITAFFGEFAARTENPLHLLIYAVCLTAAIIFQFILGIVSYVKDPDSPLNLDVVGELCLVFAVLEIFGVVYSLWLRKHPSQ